MTKPFGLIIPGQPATKKNSATMIKNRACLLPSPAYRKYEKEVRDKLNLLRSTHRIPHYTMPVKLTCQYWRRIGHTGPTWSDSCRPRPTSSATSTRPSKTSE